MVVMSILQAAGNLFFDTFKCDSHIKPRVSYLAVRPLSALFLVKVFGMCGIPVGPDYNMKPASIFWKLCGALADWRWSHHSKINSSFFSWELVLSSFLLLYHWKYYNVVAVQKRAFQCTFFHCCSLFQLIILRTLPCDALCPYVYTAHTSSFVVVVFYWALLWTWLWCNSGPFKRFSGYSDEHLMYSRQARLRRARTCRLFFSWLISFFDQGFNKAWWRFGQFCGFSLPYCFNFTALGMV